MSWGIRPTIPTVVVVKKKRSLRVQLCEGTPLGHEQQLSQHRALSRLRDARKLRKLLSTVISVRDFSSNISDKWRAPVRLIQRAKTSGG